MKRNQENRPRGNQRGPKSRLAKKTPDIAALKIIDVTPDGDIYAQPEEWEGAKPRIEIAADSKDHATLAAGDRILARVRKEDGAWIAKIIRRLEDTPTTIIGELIKTRIGYAIRTLEKRKADHYEVAESALNGAKPHTIVRGKITAFRGPGNHKAEVLDVLGAADDPKIISLVALHELGLRHSFPQDVIRESEKLPRPALAPNLTDLRDIPLVTIDGEDARDFDDAVFAERDGDGFHLIVAIADVSFYVRASTALDAEAYKRGNSTYFPDRVLPMLPEALSNDLCSLRPHEDRHTLAVHLWIDTNGHLKKYKFVRGLMKSAARLTYTQVQAAYDGTPNDLTKPLLSSVIHPLYEAYRVLLKARAGRGTLDLDLPERKIVIDEKGAMAGVTLRERFDSHKLIEEFMILANVAAAKALTEKNAPCVFRIHDRPSLEKITNLRTYLATLGLQAPKGSVTEPKQLVPLLNAARGKPFAQLVSDSLLRSQAQAVYSTDNIGHFGLALDYYAHFTSPIRRYADLIVHRSLIRAMGLGEGGLEDGDAIRLPVTCQHISGTERLSMEAERNAVDRFCAAHMADRVGATFNATISGVTRFGLFIRLAETGADGLIPMRSLEGDFFYHDERRHALIGRRTGRVYRLGAPIRVVLVEAVPLAGSLLFSAADTLSADIPGFELQVQGSGYTPRDHCPRGSRNKDRRDQKPKNRGNKGKKGGKRRG